MDKPIENYWNLRLAIIILNSYLLLIEDGTRINI